MVKVGDKVQVTTGTWAGKQGTVVEVESAPPYVVFVKLDTGPTVEVNQREVSLSKSLVKGFSYDFEIHEDDLPQFQNYCREHGLKCKVGRTLGVATLVNLEGDESNVMNARRVWGIEGRLKRWVKVAPDRYLKK